MPRFVLCVVVCIGGDYSHFFFSVDEEKVSGLVIVQAKYGNLKVFFAFFSSPFSFFHLFIFIFFIFPPRKLMLVTAKVEKVTNLLLWMSLVLFNTKVPPYNHIDNRNFYFPF